MGNSVDLLRLLEPAVRPGNLPGPIKPAAGPIESRSFDELLGEARAMAAGDPSPGAPVAAGEADAAPAKPAPPGPLAGLAQFDRVENPALRRILAAAPASD